MLVLTRKKQEQISIFVNGVVVATVTVCETGDNRTKLGLEGPGDTTFVRSELLSRHPSNPADTED